ncbi:deaminase [Fischerella thermalis CCMEE 5201]|jgi:dihydrofolate reductase|nr:deaminase [Fischerella thermalis CCMEE 5201]
MEMARTEFILYVATSIDGYIARLDGSVDWLPAPEENSYARFYDSIDALVMGSTTYEQILSFGDWPYPDKVSYVLTSRNLSTTRTDVFFVKGGIEEVLEDVNHKGYKRVWLVGGGKVASSFMNRGLVDEYIIVLIPTILGSGISLYQSVQELKLDLIELTSYPSGLVELLYKA